MTDVGEALNRDIATDEHVDRADQELDAFIERRARENRTKPQAQHEVEARWEDSERRHRAQREAESRERWVQYHRDAAERHRAMLTSLVAEHEAAAERYAAQMGEAS